MSARLARSLLAALALALVSCSALVDPDSLVIKCELMPSGTGSGTDPCLAAGMHCVDSECKPCKPDAVETCNGSDDDCDGVIDEGQDADGDGFTWCGYSDRSLADCNDNDPSIHPAGKTGPDGKPGVPAAAEACDGK